MPAAVWMIELGRNSWRLSVEREGQSAPIAAKEFATSELASQADAIQAAMTANGYFRDTAVLALESAWCLAAAIPTDRPSELQDEQLMAFRFEEWIPWGAEDFVADFCAAGNHALAIAAPSELLVAFISRLAELDVPLESIVPWAVLVAAAHVARGVQSTAHVLLVERDGWIDLLAVDGSQILAWKHMPTIAMTLFRELECLALETGTAPRIDGYHLSAALSAELARFGFSILPPSADTARASTSELALIAATCLGQGSLYAPIELKRGRFGRSRGHVALRRHVASLQVALAVLLLTITGTLLFRGHRANREAERFTTAQAEAFRSVFPTAKVPVGIASRLKSELAKLKGLQGDDQALTDSVSVTTVLHRMLSALPTDRRFRLLEIRIEEGRLYLDGEVRDHGDAEAIALRLRAESFEVPPPKTQRLDGERVTMRISGNLLPTNNLHAKTTR